MSSVVASSTTSGSRPNMYATQPAVRISGQVWTGPR